MAEGFAHTRNRARYFITILSFDIISEIPCFLLNSYDGTHNVMFTLAIRVAALAVFDRLCEHRPLCVIVISLLLALAYWTAVDYDWRGVLMIVLFYMLRLSLNIGIPSVISSLRTIPSVISKYLFK
ncbi:MAG: hypothetical protein HDS37_07860 [Bacteroides sp.]|nr:hypothetical protein [Bacteroides sp.]